MLTGGAEPYNGPRLMVMTDELVAVSGLVKR
jgi:hypothetical protein